MATPKTLGELIKQTREAKKVGHPEFTIRQFALAVGLSPAFMSKLENGDIDPPSPEKLKKIAEKLDLDPNVLLQMAGKIDPELKNIVVKRQVEMATFLRTVNGLSREHLETLRAQAEKMKEEQNGDDQSAEQQKKEGDND